MLGKTAGGLYWMFRSLERAENTARLIEAGFRIALTRSNDTEAEWRSVIATSAVQEMFDEKYQSYDSTNVINFLLCDVANPSSVYSVLKSARDNARLVRTAITTEVWSAINGAWMLLSDRLKKPISETDLPDVLASIRMQSALVRGALYGTMMRNDIFDFCRLGTYIERMNCTARIIDVKYYSLLPSPSFVNSTIDNVQWETVLRSVSAHRAFRWAGDGEYNAPEVATFLILDGRMPRSLTHCSTQIVASLGFLAKEYDTHQPCLGMAEQLRTRFNGRDISTIFEDGLHEFVNSVIADIDKLGYQIEQDYRFNK
ncbi:hypothetical protein GCM10008927_08040 [Amylibacter ulvae]|uniref:DUF403 domain-containing protein n=1 Tax=Paramylibacter ulvae TaxID=1651968 RepID=A0ABQ3CV67_9RHOB|nr:alpha-E domain-containing protein [Amylibacter ulvae]GHA45462.1 hypothetical protein GCM10008927_08040 [Amylibacter ulvae]